MVPNRNRRETSAGWPVYNRDGGYLAGVQALEISLVIGTPGGGFLFVKYGFAVFEQKWVNRNDLGHCSTFVLQLLLHGTDENTNFAHGRVKHQGYGFLAIWAELD